MAFLFSLFSFADILLKSPEIRYGSFKLNSGAAASVLGLTVVGCLIASVIGVTCPISFSFGDVSMEIQPLLDKILPAMIPAAITGSAYYLLTKKNASMTALILVVIVLAMVASAAGILA